MNESEVMTNRTVVGRLAHSLDLYLPPILIVVGVTSNTFVILVMRTSFFNKTSTSLYMVFNAIVDYITLAVAFPAHWIHVSFPEVIYRGDYSDLICKMFHFIGASTSNIGIVLTAAMTLERAIAIKFPLKAPSVCTKRKVKIVTLALVVFVCLKDLHYLILSEMVSEDFLQYLCEVKPTNEFLKVYHRRVWPIVQNITLFTSFIVIIIGNIIIIRSVKLSWQTQNTVNRSSREVTSVPTGRTKRYKQITVMLILDSVTIIICTLPFALLGIMRLDYGNKDIEHLVFSVCFYLVYVNRCANFFLYCVSGSKFRQALKTLCIRRRSSNGNTSSVYAVSSTPLET